MMKKRNKLLLQIIFVGLFFLSVFFNFQNNSFERLQHVLSGSSQQDSNATQDPVDGIPDTVIVYYLKNVKVTKIESVSSAKSMVLPDEIILPPGVYSFAGKNYSLEQEGLYRFVVPGKMNLQRIVYQSNQEALLSAISWIVSHGNTDDSKTMSLLTAKALHSKLFVTCGTVSKWARNLLNSIGIESRIVGGITVDEWNDYDNGHILLEVWQQRWNKWVVYDLDNNSFFLSLHSEIPLSVVEMSTLVGEKKYRIQPLADDTRLDVSGFHSKTGYDYSFFSEGINADIHSWYARVMQVPLVFDDKQRVFMFMDAEQKTRVESYSANYKYLERNKFMNKYYEVRN